MQSIKAHNLEKSFGAVKAVQNYSVEIKQGDVLIITGIKECVSEKNNQSSKFYEVKFNEKYLFIEVDFLICEKDFYGIINDFTEIEKNSFRENSSKLADIQRLEKLKKFDEFIKLQDPLNTITMNPSVGQLTSELKNKTLRVSWEASLLPETTYILQLNGTIRDNTESNDSIYQFVFSSGG